MNGSSDQVGWTDVQWNRVREEVLQAWQRVRVAGGFLPVYGPLLPSTQVVPSEVVNADGTVDDQATATLLEIALPVTLSRQQVREDDLSSALLQFRRRAAQLGQLEDWYVFNGVYPGAGFTVSSRGAEQSYGPEVAFLRGLDLSTVLTGAPRPIADAATQIDGLRRRNPGALGLIAGSAGSAGSATRTSGTTGDEKTGAEKTGDQKTGGETPRAADVLIKGVVDGITTLQQNGFVAPYVCVFGREPFLNAFALIDRSTSAPRDRLEPLIGSALLHASAIDVPPEGSSGERERWPKRGVLLSLVDDAVDLVVAVAATPEFRRIDDRGRYTFVVYERFALRIKDPTAIVALNLGA